MAEPRLFACPTCGRRYQVPPAAQERFVDALCWARVDGPTHRTVVMRVVEDVAVNDVLAEVVEQSAA